MPELLLISSSAQGTPSPKARSQGSQSQTESRKSWVQTQQCISERARGTDRHRSPGASKDTREHWNVVSREEGAGRGCVCVLPQSPPPLRSTGMTPRRRRLSSAVFISTARRLPETWPFWMALISCKNSLSSTCPFLFRSTSLRIS